MDRYQEKCKYTKVEYGERNVENSIFRIIKILITQNLILLSENKGSDISFLILISVNIHNIDIFVP